MVWLLACPLPSVIELLFVEEEDEAGGRMIDFPPVFVTEEVVPDRV